MSRFKYSPISSDDVNDKLLIQQAPMMLCLTSALEAPSTEKHDAMIEWISGPLKTIDDVDAVADMLDVFQRIIQSC